MKLPVSWLRDFVDVRVDPRRLGEDLTMIGFALDGLEGEGDDAVLDVDVTTNRVDAMNVYGLAREVAALYGLPLRALDLSFTESGPPAAEALEVTVEAADLCPRFCARVLDVRMGPSPAWLRERLERVGVRPISNLVDLTNYVMMEMGHPSHAFDLAKVPGGHLRIRWAREGERLRTLDGVERALTARIGVVAGPAQALALAGVMGGESSEVSPDTQAVALEAAYWEPLAIRRGARTLSLHTEASHRFERGADPEGPAVATARIAHLLQAIGAGTTRPGLIDRVASPRLRRTVVLRPARIDATLGAAVPPAKAEAVLTDLGFEVTPAGSDAWSVTVPTWRSDVSREVDLVEEVARHHGLDKIGADIPPSDGIGTLASGQREERLVRSTLAAAGLNEVIQWAFGTAGLAEGPRPIPLANPLADPQSALRTSLVMPGLIEALETNARLGRKDVALFEVGRVFLPGDDMPIEERRLGILLAGAARAAHWSEKSRAFDVFDLIGVLESLLERLGVPGLSLAAAGPRPTFLHPGRSGAVMLDGEVIGWLGALGPGVREGRETVLVAEIGLGPLLARARPPVRVEPLPRFPAVNRDLSVACGAAVVAADLLALVRRAAGPWLRRVEVADRYDGHPLPPGKVSLMLSLSYQHPERTLAGEEVQASVEAVIRVLRGTGFEIRGD